MNCKITHLFIGKKVLVLLGLLSSQFAWTQDYEAGRSAYISGDYQQAYQILRPLAESGDSEAQKIMGIMYDYGHGVEKDPKKALDWYLRSAEQGQPAVQYQVGAKYFRGDGVKQDYLEAAKWWELAANGGQVDAQFNLGLMYYRGLSLERDNSRAAELFRLAAEQGHSHAQYSLAVMYSFGQGVTKDHNMALDWFQKSAEQGVAQAQFNMGVYYENGYAVNKDIDIAKKWYERASAQGLAEAQEKITALAETDTPSSSVSQNEYTIEEIQPDGIKREHWVMKQQPGSYTLQIGSVVNEKDIVNFIRENHIEHETAYIEVVINGVTRFNALYGVYDSYEAARDAARNDLPNSLRRAKPWVRNFGILQDMLK